MGSFFHGRISGGAFTPVSLGFLLLVVVQTSAQEPDYTKGFEKFSQYGIPDVKNATYMNLTTSHGISQPFDFAEYDDNGLPVGDSNSPKPTGNAWLLETKPDGGRVFLMDGCSTIEVYPQEIVAKEQQEKLKEASSKKMSRLQMARLWGGVEAANAKIGGTWKEVDPAKDIKLLIEHLQKKTAKANGNRKYQMESGGWGKLFLTAYHCHRKGLTAEANQILKIVFQEAGDSRKVIQQALNQVANAQYQEIYQAFNRSGDWAQFSASLEKLLTRFPNNWGAPLVKRLAAQVGKRAALKEPLPVAGEGLTDEDKTLARELIDQKSASVPYGVATIGSVVFWIIGNPQMSMYLETDSALGKIVKRKIRSVPLLIALLKDDTLTSIGLQGGSNQSRMHHQTRETPISDDEIEMMYQSLPRPMSRGEIAKWLLAPLVLSQEEQYSGQQPDMDSIQQKGLQWYAKNKDKTDSELVRFYLTDGNELQKQAAIGVLVSSEKEEDVKSVEKYFMESKNSYNDLNYAQQYATRRGAKAREFVEKYVAKMKATPPTMPGLENSGMDEAGKKQMAEHVERTLAILTELVSDQTAESILAELSSGKTAWSMEKWQQMYAPLSKKLAAEKPEKALTLLLNASLKTQDTLLISQLLTLVSQLNQLQQFAAAAGGMLPEEDGDEPAAKPSPEAAPAANLKVETHADAWKKLLADQREVIQEQTAIFGIPSSTVAQSSGGAMETLYGEKGIPNYQRHMNMAKLGKKVWDLYRMRGEARLAGKTEDQLPPFPSADRVTDPRRTQLKERLMGMESGDLPKALNALSLDEQLALNEILPGDEKLNAKLAPLANTILEVKIDVEDSKIRQHCEALKGKILDKKMIEELLADSKTLLQDGKPVSMAVSRLACVQGIEIRVSKVSPKQKNPWITQLVGGFGSAQKSMVFGFLMSQDASANLHAQTIWTIDAPATANLSKAKPAETKNLSQSEGDDRLEQDAELNQSHGMFSHYEKQKDAFWAKIDIICGPKFNACSPVTISLIGIPLPEKK